MKTLLPFLLALLLPPAPLRADAASAFTALQRGRVAEAEQLLRAASPQNAYTHLLLCRVFYAQEQADRAIPECEAAATAAPSDTQNQLWLGRAYGQKARQAGPLTGFALARKVHVAFERAIVESPANIAAVNDLGEFYVAAPSIVGGGIDKAQTLADTVQSRSPAAAHRIRAYIAVKQKDLRAAEAEFKAEVAVARTPSAYVDLGLFYQLHAQPDQAESTLRNAIDANTSRTSALVDAASVLIDLSRAPDLAEQALRAYLLSPLQSDDAPTFKVHLQLGRLLARRGDLPGARREYATALDLAPDFGPAQQAVSRAAGKGA